MIVALLPNDRGRARVLALNCVREGGTVRAPLVLCDGGAVAGVYPARLIRSATKEEALTLRIPDLEDGEYRDEVFEVIE